MLFAEVATTAKARYADPEDIRAGVSQVLARVITEVEGLGGVVTSVSGRGLEASLRGPRGPRGRPRAGGPGRVSVLCQQAQRARAAMSRPCGWGSRRGRRW